MNEKCPISGMPATGEHVLRFCSRKHVEKVKRQLTLKGQIMNPFTVGSFFIGLMAGVLLS